MGQVLQSLNSGTPFKRENSIMKTLIIFLTTIFISGCYYYPPAPVVYSTKVGASKFDQSWSAAIGALSDQGVRITVQDRGAGVMQGNLNGIEVAASIRTQADNSVRVQFNTSGATTRDPTIIQRITNSYHSRMGR